MSEFNLLSTESAYYEYTASYGVFVYSSRRVSSDSYFIDVFEIVDDALVLRSSFDFSAFAITYEHPHRIYANGNYVLVYSSKNILHIYENDGAGSLTKLWQSYCDTDFGYVSVWMDSYNNIYVGGYDGRGNKAIDKFILIPDGDEIRIEVDSTLDLSGYIFIGDWLYPPNFVTDYVYVLSTSDNVSVHIVDLPSMTINETVSFVAEAEYLFHTKSFLIDSPDTGDRNMVYSNSGLSLLATLDIGIDNYLCYAYETDNFLLLIDDYNVLYVFNSTTFEFVESADLSDYIGDYIKEISTTGNYLSWAKDGEAYYLASILFNSILSANVSITKYSNSDHIFNSSEIQFTSSLGTSYSGFKLATLPLYGTLKYNGSSASIDTLYPTRSLLSYSQISPSIGVAFDSFTFSVVDDASNESDVYTITINGEYGGAIIKVKGGGKGIKSLPDGNNFGKYSDGNNFGGYDV